MHSLHLLAAVRGPGLLEVDANPNPLREGLLGDLLAVAEGCVSLPDGQGLGLEPDLKPLANLRSLHIERHA
jgi:L-alanine-DL-glutamate epimerase-like enolase superfamily enzyme